MGDSSNHPKFSPFLNGETGETNGFGNPADPNFDNHKGQGGSFWDCNQHAERRWILEEFAGLQTIRTFWGWWNLYFWH
jgi:hypothetical protein